MAPYPAPVPAAAGPAQNPAAVAKRLSPPHCKISAIACLVLNPIKVCPVIIPTLVTTHRTSL